MKLDKKSFWVGAAAGIFSTAVAGLVMDGCKDNRTTEKEPNKLTNVKIMSENEIKPPHPMVQISTEAGKQ